MFDIPRVKLCHNGELRRNGNFAWWSYAGARKMVVKVGNILDIKLRPHDLRRYDTTYASRSGVTLEIVSKVIHRHADLSTTQR